LNVNKGWNWPYESPIEQLSHSYFELQEVINGCKVYRYIKKGVF